MRILRDFFYRILWEFFGDVWLGGLNVWVLILGNLTYSEDIKTDKEKTITRSAELECSRLKRIPPIFFSPKKQTNAPIFTFLTLTNF